MRVLLHTCCGICASHCIHVLRAAGHTPVLFFSNSNIAPHAEYLRRREAAITLAQREGVEWVEDLPEHTQWMQAVAQGFEACPEGGDRCARCFAFSLKRAYAALEQTQCEAFTTSLTVSPHKNSKLLLQIGHEIGGETFLPFDFKKNNGYQESCRLATAYQLYRQRYCGCEFSMRHPQPFKMVLLGCGYRGQVYAQWILEHPRDATIVAIAEPDDTLRQRVGDELGLSEAHRFTDWRAVIAHEPEAEAAIIALPDSLHVEAALEALHHGLHLLLEKPIARSLAECEALEAAATMAERLIIVPHLLRYTPYGRKAHQFLHSGVIGEVVSIQHIEPVGYMKAAHSFCRGNWGNVTKSSPMILQKCCHDFDQFVWWLDGVHCQRVQSFGSLSHFKASKKPEGAADRCCDCPSTIERDCPWSARKHYIERHDLAYTRTLPQNPDETFLKESRYGRCVYACDNDAPDHQTVNLLFENGVTIAHSMESFTFHRERITRVFGTRGELVGDSRTITIYDFAHRITHKWDAVLEAAQPDAGYTIGNDAFMTEFIHQLRTGTPAQWTRIFHDSIQSHRIAFAAERSRMSGGESINPYA